jgi:hypothetical protein
MRLATRTFIFAAIVLLLRPGTAAAQDYDQLINPTFEFHSGFWINLHHFLYVQGRLRQSASQPRTTPDLVQAAAAPASTDGLSPEQIVEWNAAVEAYAAEWSSRDLLLNGDMVIINNRLAEMEDCPELSGKVKPACEPGLKPNLVTALNQAAGVYRAHWWSDQDRANRTWIAGVAPLVRQFGMGLAAQLAEIYETNWPRQPIRVDVVWSAGQLGAYTTLNPVHVTMGSGDARNQGLTSFEVLFHEASHVLAEGVNKAIAQACRDRGKPIPRDLWHALLYYTTGELARREYAGANPPVAPGGPGYTPYADRNGLYNQDWDRYHRLLQLYWQPYLDGKVTFETAIVRLVNSL